MTKERKYYIDIIKIVAILLVCFIHSGQTGFAAYYYTGGKMQIVQAAIAVACKVSVPLFFMCTGALLLGREETIKELWLKRVLRYIVITVVFTILYYAYLSIRNQTAIDIPFILKTMYNTWGYSHSGSYWFLYSYIGFLILLPLLRVIAKSLDENIMMYIIVVNTVACSVLPMLESRFGMQDLGVKMVLITSDVFFYPFLGYYIEKCDFKELFTKKNMGILCGMSFLSVITSVFYSLKYIKLGIFTEEYIALFQIYLVMFIYVMAKGIAEKVSLREGILKVIAEVSKCTFGIYLIHGIIYVPVDDYLIAKGIPFTYPLAWGRAMVVFLISLICVWICRRIPIVKKLF